MCRSPLCGRQDSAMTDPFLSLTAITKPYPGVKALDGVSLAVVPRRGHRTGRRERCRQVDADEGAGRGGRADIGGEIVLDGRALDRLTVPQAIAAGIAFVHQELNLFDNLDVAANVLIGREPLKGGPLRLVDRRRMAAMVQPWSRHAGRRFQPVDAGRGPVDRPAPAAGDRQGAEPGRPAGDHGRADLQPDAVRDRAPAGCRRAAEGRRAMR